MKLELIDALDIESLGLKIGNNDFVGRPMFDPKNMLKLMVYGYFNVIRSSRKLAKQAKINREVIWLINGLQPKYRVINIGSGTARLMSKHTKNK